MSLQYNKPLKLEPINYFTGLWLLLCHDPAHDFNISNFASRMASIDNYIRSTIGGGSSNEDNYKTDETYTPMSSDIEDADEDKIYMNLCNEEFAETIANFNLLHQKLTNEYAYTSEKRYQTREITKTQNMIKLYTDILDKYKFYILSLTEEPSDMTIPSTVFSTVDESNNTSRKRRTEDVYDNNEVKKPKVGGSHNDIYNKMDNQIRTSFNYIINNKDTTDKLKNVTKTLLYGYEILQNSNTEISPYIIFNSYYLEIMTLFVMIQDISVDENIAFNLLNIIVPLKKEIDYRNIEPEPVYNTIGVQPVGITAGSHIKIGGNIEAFDRLKNIVNEIKEYNFNNMNGLYTIHATLKTIKEPLTQKIVRSITGMLASYDNHNKLLGYERKALERAGDRTRSKIEAKIAYLETTYPIGECDKLLNMITEVQIKLIPKSKSKSNSNSKSTSLSTESKKVVSKVLQILVNKFLTLSETFNRPLNNDLDKQYLDGLTNIGKSVSLNQNMSGIDSQLLELSDWYFENKVDDTYEKKGYVYYLPTKDDIFTEDPIIINNSAQTKDFWGIRNEQTVGCSYTTYLDAQGAISSSCTSGKLSSTEIHDNFEFSIEENNNETNYYVGGFYKKSKNIGNIIYTTQYADNLYFTQNIKVNIGNLNSIIVLSANNTLKRIMDTLTQIWSTGNNMDWDKRWSYFDNSTHFNTLLSTISEKGIGDFYQEMNVIVRNGGYKSLIKRARRGTMGDRPSGCRAAYYLLNTINPRESIHPICDIGYYSQNDKSISLYYNVNKSTGGKGKRTKTRNVRTNRNRKQKRHTTRRKKKN